MQKQTELRTATSCLNKAAFDEPIFVLRAKDPLAPQAVRLWATMSIGRHEPDKIDEAMHLAEQMERYRSANYPEPAAPTAAAEAPYRNR